jgi:hypothetical protein
MRHLLLSLLVFAPYFFSGPLIQAQSKAELIPYPINARISKPLISASGDELYFTLFSTKVINGFSSDTGEFPDIYFLQRDSLGNLGGELRMIAGLKTSAVNLVYSISADNRQFFTRSHPWPSNYDLLNQYRKAYAFQKNKGVQVMQMSIFNAQGELEYFPVFLRKFRDLGLYIDIAVSSNGHVLLASLQGPDSNKSGEDIYVSFREDFNIWSPLQKLPEGVNSEANEYGLFLAADQRTLYFSSNRHQEDEYKIYVTHRLDSTWLNWSEPQMLDNTINDSPISMYLTISPNGSSGIMVKRREVENRSYLYNVELAEAFSAHPTHLFLGEFANKELLSAKTYFQILLKSASGELEGQTYLFENHPSFGFNLRDNEAYTLFIYDHNGVLLLEKQISAGEKEQSLVLELPSIE